MKLQKMLSKALALLGNLISRRREELPPVQQGIPKIFVDQKNLAVVVSSGRVVGADPTNPNAPEEIRGSGALLPRAQMLQMAVELAQYMNGADYFEVRDGEIVHKRQS